MEQCVRFAALRIARQEEIVNRLLSTLTLAIASAFVIIAMTPAPVATAPQSAPSPAALKDALYVVSHVDLAPDAVAKDQSALQQYVADSRKDPGALRIELLVQSDRPNHFTIVSVWADEKAFNAHLEAAHTRDFRAKIQAGLGSPFDERLHKLLP
jgi:quinol monooxygenase YgiN